MSWMIAAALQAAAPPALPAEVAFLPVASAGSPASNRVDAVLTGLPRSGGPRLRRSALDPAPFARCLERTRLSDDEDFCVRGLLPRGEAELPLVAILIEEDRRSNITGRIVRKSVTIRCVAHRGVGRAVLGNALGTASEIDRARDPVRQCIANALRIPAQARIDVATGAATWRFPVRSEGLIRDTALARGNGLERAIVDIEERRVAGETAGGECTLQARVSRVLGGWWLRDGDTVLLGLPCGTNGVRHGRPAHLMIDYERALRYLEPL
jgi:hypothetical protein